jgi:uncharacterized membrane protein YhaH (DUF805 family)
LKELLFTARGRVNRAAFWKGVIIMIAATLVAGLAMYGYGSLIPHETASDGALHVEGVAALPFVLGIFVTLGFDIAVGICLAIKRFHDRDKSGWWILIQFVPIVGALWYVIELGFLAGTPGPNGFGPDPLAGLSARTAIASA